MKTVLAGAIALVPLRCHRSAGRTIPDERRNRVDLRDRQRCRRPARTGPGQGGFHRPRQRRPARHHVVLERGSTDHRDGHLDMSGSMFSRFVRLRTSTISFVDALQPRDRAQIGTFGEEIRSARIYRRQAAAQARAEHRVVAEWADANLERARPGDDGSLVGVRKTRGDDDYRGRELCNYRHCVKAGAVERRAVREGFMLARSAWTAPASTTKSC